MSIIKEIDDYITFLKTDYSLDITLHPAENEYLISDSRLIKYNFHTSDYCTFLKGNPSLWEMCIEKQQKIREKLLQVNCFTGICHAGVKERVYGLYLRGKYMGFISVSGYKAEENTGIPRLKKICSEFSFDYDETCSAYGHLKDTFPSEEFLDCVIFPLKNMIEYGNLMLPQVQDSANNLYIELLRYINAHFSERLSRNLLAEIFSVSPSKISHTFKKYNGKSIREHINFLRLEASKNLLKYSSKSITEIALCVGFSDSCYFCNSFRKAFGITAYKYRNNKTHE